MAQAKHRSTEDRAALAARFAAPEAPKSEDVSDKLRSELHALLKASDALKVRAEAAEADLGALRVKVSEMRQALQVHCPGKVW